MRILREKHIQAAISRKYLIVSILKSSHLAKHFCPIHFKANRANART